MFGVELDEVVRDEVELVEGLDEVVRESFELELVGENKVEKKQYLVVGILKVLKVFMVNLTHITVKIGPKQSVKQTRS